MREYRSLKPAGLPEGFDGEIQGEQPIVKVEESKGKITLSYIFPGFYISEDSRDVDGKKVSFKQCNIDKIGFISKSGKPLLPSFGRYVQIPFNCDYKVITKKSKPVQFSDVMILPAQELLMDHQDEDHIFEFDKKFYSKDELYPKEIVEVSGPFEIDDYNAILVHVRPFQYNPAKRKLIGYGNIDIKIILTPVKKKSDKNPYLPSDLNREGYGNFFLNPRRRVEDRIEIGPIRIGPFLPIPYGPEFIIIYHDIFKDEAKKLAKWKNTRGLLTETISVGSISDIKTYIRNKRKSIFSRLRYVMLFGDVDMIKPENIGGVVTDYYYSTEKDSATTSYVMPWLSIGRIPVRTKEEGLAVVNKIIKYEKTPPENSEYYTRMVFAAYFQDDSPQDGKDDRCYMKTMEDIRDQMITLGFNVNRVYVSNNPNPKQYCDGTSVSTAVKNSIVNASTATSNLIAATTEGQLIMGHRDHGDWDGWSHPPFTISNLDNITGEMPTIFYSINCLTGKFDLPVPQECFAEKLLRLKGGAPSLIAATRVSGTWRNHSLIKALFDGTWGGVIATFPGSTASYPVKYNRLGDLLNYAKSYLPVKHSGDNPGIKNHFEIYHTIGDPTLELWKTKPITINIKTIVKEGYLNIILSTCPKGCVITVWYGEKMIKRIEPSSTYLKISLKDLELFTPLPPTMKRSISVCFWAPGYRFQQINLSI